MYCSKCDCIIDEENQEVLCDQCGESCCENCIILNSDHKLVCFECYTDTKE